ncbi:hypothetical protein MRBLMG1_006544 [Streptomyces sp. LMG1-1-1.1]
MEVVADARDEDPYPDVTASGGLVEALRQTAEERGRDIGLSPWAVDAVGMESTRGTLSVATVTGQRLFRLRAYIPDFGWDIGSTDDLGRMVDLIAAWREGVPTEVLKARFDFLDVDEFTRALEAGEPTSARWADLLSNAYHQGQWSLLGLLHADEVLRNAFPTMTHRAVRLQVDPMHGTSRQVLVYEPEEGRYEVRRVGVPGDDWTEVPGDRLIVHLRAALYDAPPS